MMPAAIDRPSFAPLRSRALGARLDAFRRLGVLRPSEVHAVDRLAALAGVDDVEALLAMTLAVRAPRLGHVCLDVARARATVVLEPDAADNAAPDWPVDAAAWLDRLRACPRLVRAADEERVTPFVLDGSRLYTDRSFRFEVRLAARLRARADATVVPTDLGLLGAGLRALFAGAAPGTVDRQQLAAASALLRRLAVITGGPGTGKTTTVKKILVLLYAQWAAARAADPALRPLRIALGAPTGKAAARMKEAIRADLAGLLAAAPPALGGVAAVAEIERLLLDLEASTLHRLLGYRPGTAKPFRHDAGDPLPVDVVIVDEASMVDVELMARLLAATPDAARLVLLGDQHQLASVEAGTVLRDICGRVPFDRLERSTGFAGELAAAGLDLGGGVLPGPPGLGDGVTVLDRNYRFSAESGIGRFARACLVDDFDAQRAIDVLGDGARDVRLLPPARGARPGAAAAALPEEVVQVIVRRYGAHLAALHAGPRPDEAEAGFHERILAGVEGFRVLCAHRRGPLGVESLNRAIEVWLRAGPARELRDFDPRRPDYLGRPILVRANDYQLGLFNGDLGVVVRRALVDGRSARAVAFRAAAGGLRYVALAQLPDHETVYAMTIHKSQGSEFDHVVVVLPDRPSPILTRELIYTAVTRARTPGAADAADADADPVRLWLVADHALLQDALERRVERASGLEARLWGPVTSSPAPA